MSLPPVSFPSLGWQVIDWIEHMLVHGPGDIEGEEIEIDDEIALFLCWVYRLHPPEHKEAGRRLIQRAVLSRPKGRSKSETAGAVVCAEALGPVRFDHWAEAGEVSSWGYEYGEGEPVGRPVRSPFIRCLATEEDQAGNTYDNVVVMLTQGRIAEEFGLNFGKEVGLTRTFLPGGGEIRPSTSGNESKDGGLETLSISDEALALDTPLPTPDGWTTMGEVKLGDSLIGADGRSTEVLKATGPQVGRRCFQVTFEDRTSLIASDGHLWMAKPTPSMVSPGVQTTEEMFADGRRFRVPAPKPYETPRAELDIDPYVLGMWLGDGDSRNATISVGDEDLHETERLIQKCGYTVRRCTTHPDRANLLYVSVPGSHRNRFSPVRGLKVRLGDAGLLGNKHVPAEYLRASIAQRTALLQGLMDSDGHADKGGGCTFVGNDQLSRDILALLRTLGQSVRRIWCPDERSRVGGYHKVNFSARGGLAPFRLPRKAQRVKPHRRGPGWVTITSIEPVESRPVRCVAVDALDHLFLAGAGGHVTHNTHLYVLPKLRKMYATVSRNTGKRKDGEPWVFDTTTAWQPGERSIAEQAADKYAHLDIEEAVLKRGVLYDHRQGNEPVRFGDDRSLIKALKTGYGPASEWMDFKRIVKIIRDAEDPENDAYRYWLNRPRAAASHWLSPEEIRAVLGTVVALPDSVIGLGFDGSENDDHTALKGCTEDGDLFTIGVWTPEGNELGWRKQVMEAVDWAFDTFKVARYKFDPAWWNSEGADWAADHGAPPVEEFWTGGRSEGKMAVATGALRTEIKHGTITIDPKPLRTEEIFRDGKSLVQWHYENARTRKVRVKREEDGEAEDAYIIRKERKGSPLKIDSVTSDVLAKKARDDAFKTGEFAGEPEFKRGAW